MRPWRSVANRHGQRAPSAPQPPLGSAAEGLDPATLLEKRSGSEKRQPHLAANIQSFVCWNSYIGHVEKWKVDPNCCWNWKIKRWDNIYMIMINHVYTRLFRFNLRLILNTAPALHKNSLYKKLRGWKFYPCINFVVHIRKLNIRNWATLAIVHPSQNGQSQGRSGNTRLRNWGARFLSHTMDSHTQARTGRAKEGAAIQD